MKSYKSTDEYGTIYYKNYKGELHNEQGPAAIVLNGSRYCFIRNKMHREDGPGVEWEDGTKHWWLNGKCHLEDGPAIEWEDGSKHWFLNNIILTEEEFKKAILKKTLEDLIQ